MKVTSLKATSAPERLVCKAARNDYEDRWIGETDYTELMSGIDYDEDDAEWALSEAKERDVPIGDTIEDTPYETVARERSLIRHLLDRGHYGPFEHPHITFAIKGVSRSCMAQLTRHRHASFDVQSMRYVEFDEQQPEAGDEVVSIPELKDGGLVGRNAEFNEMYEDMDDDQVIEDRKKVYERAIQNSFHAYNAALEAGVAPENARMLLPIGTKVNVVVTVNIRTLMHIADMRAAADAQWEIRELTEKILDIAEEWAPATFEYYNEQMKNRKNRLAP